MKTDRQVIEETLSRIENPSDWVQNSYYQDEHGNNCDPEQAVRMCAVGALWLSVDLGDPQYDRVVGAILSGTGYQSLSGFNDSRLHSEVVLQMKRTLDLVDG